MQPLYFRAYAYGEETTPTFEVFYWLYSTNCYDYCTPYRTLAVELQGKTTKEIRKIMKEYHQPIKKIAKGCSRYARKTPEDAIHHLIQRKHYRERCLQTDLTLVRQFIDHTKTTTVADMLAKSNKTYHTDYK